jgi:hypothetical protein
MKRSDFSALVTSFVVVLFASLAHAEILATLNYESKPDQMIRKEGLAIIDVYPKSQTFGKMLMDIPLQDCPLRGSPESLGMEGMNQTAPWEVIGCILNAGRGCQNGNPGYNAFVLTALIGFSLSMEGGQART